MLESLSKRRKGTGMNTNSKARIVMAEEPHSNLVLSFQASKRKRYRVSFIILICQMGKKKSSQKIHLSLLLLRASFYSISDTSEI